MIGTRYASDFPVPVPACTIRCRPDSIASAIAWVMSLWPIRRSPPPGSREVTSSSWSNTSVVTR